MPECKVCNENKAIEDFYKKPNGYDTTCKKCREAVKSRDRFLKTHKKCPKCEEFKKLKEFYTGKNHISCCKDCWSQYKSKSYHASLDQSRATSRQYAKDSRHRRVINSLDRISGRVQLSDVLDVIGKNNIDMRPYIGEVIA